MAIGGSTTYKNLQVILTANVSSFRGAMASAARDVALLDAEVGRVNQTSRTTSAGLSGIGTSAGNAARATSLLKTGLAGITAVGLVAAGRAAIEFDKNMHNVVSLMTSSGLSAKTLNYEFSSLSDQVLELSKTVPQSAGDLSKGLYDVVSAGIPASQAIEVLTASAKAASAGLASTSDSVKAITGVMNAYGPSAGNAAHISDVLFQTVNAGVIEFSELAQGVGQVTSLASAAQVPIQDVGSAIAAMTRAGINAASSTTDTKRVIQELINPSEALSAVYKTLGYASGAAALQQDGLYGVMQKVRQVTGGSAQSTLELFKDIRAATGAFALMSNAGQTYASTQQAITDGNSVNGATQRALEEQSKSLSFQLGLLRNNFSALGISVYKDATPALVDVTKAIGGVAGVAKDHTQIIELLAVLYGVKLVAGLNIVQTALGGITTRLTAAAAATRAAGEASTLFYGEQSVMAGLAGAAWTRFTGLLMANPWIVLAGAVVAVQTDLNKADGAAKSFANSISSQYDLSTTQGLNRAIIETQQHLADAKNEANSLKKSYQPGVGTAIEGLFGKDSMANANANVKELQKSLDSLNAKKELLNQTPATNEVSSFLQSIGDSADDTVDKITALAKAGDELSTVFAGYSSADTAFKSALSDSQKAASDAAAAANKTSSSTLSQQKRDLSAQHQAELQSLQNKKAAVSNHNKAGLEQINAEISQTKTRQKLESNQLANTKAVNSESAKSTKDATDQATVSIDQYLAKLKSENEDLENFQTNLVKIAGKYGYDVAEALKKLGPESAPLIAAFASDTSAKGQAAADAIVKSLNLDAAGPNIEAQMQAASTAANKGAEQIGLSVAAGLKSGLVPVADAVKGYGQVLNETADPVLQALGLPTLTAGKNGPYAPGTKYRQTYDDNNQRIAIPNFAQGGIREDHTAQIAPGGSMRLWAEPETGGEAYIPLHPSKRSRSVDIWQRTGELLGMMGGSAKAFANGGLKTGPFGIPTPTDQGSAAFEQMANVTMQRMYQAVLNAAGAAQGAQGGANGGGGSAGPAPKGQVVDWIHQAEAIAGWPDSYTNGLYQLIMHESGGNPSAINLTDSNAKAGHPSQGLMQTIPTTFAAYSYPGHKSITNPIDNILAGTAYALKNYGPGMIMAGGRHAPSGAYVGYANGGLNMGVYDQGGGLRPGYTLAYNGTGKTEHVMTENQINRIVTAIESNSGGSKTVVFQGDGRSAEEKRQLRRALA